MTFIWYRSAQIIFISCLSFLQMHPGSTLYLAIMLQSICLHISVVSSLSICIAGCILCPTHCVNILALWIVAYIVRNKIYLSHDNPLILLGSIITAFAVASLLTKDWYLLRILFQACCAFTFTVNGGLVWIARYTGSKEISNNLFLAALLSLYAAGLWILPLKGVMLIMGLLLAETYQSIFSSFTRNLLAIFSCIRLIGLSLAERDHWIFIFIVISYSVISAYKGLLYDLQKDFSLPQGSSFRAKYSYRTLPFGKKLSSSRL